MIFVDINGNIGDQLFQYATARSLSIDKNTDFLMDLSYYEENNSEKFQLNHFNINIEKQIDKKEIEKYSNVKTINERIPSENYVEYIKLNVPNENVYLKGKWENEKYFLHNIHYIKNDLKIITPPKDKYEKIINEINLKNDVCVSVMRNETMNSYSIAQEGICTENYYQNSMNLISHKIKNPTFIILTDDKKWVEKYINTNFSTKIIEFDDLKESFERLQLMTCYENFIIGNDNISWWGAWLSQNKNKTVFAPTPWFNSFTKQNVLCPDWIHIKSDRSDLFNNSSTTIFELKNEKALSKIKCEDIEKDIGHYGFKINISKSPTNMAFLLDNSVDEELIIELKLFSLKKGVIIIDYGEENNIALGYKKGHSIRYLHLFKISLSNLNLKFNDDTLSIENIIIKKIIK